MPPRSPRTSTYRLHKASGQGVATIDGRDFYLGLFGTGASRSEYDPIVGEWLANGRQLPTTAGETSDLTINELCLAYLRFADGYCVKNGKPTVEPGNIRLAIRPPRKLYGATCRRANSDRFGWRPSANP